MSSKSNQDMDIYEVFQQLEIPYTKHDHPAVYTCEEAEKHLGHLTHAGSDKNLFLRNRKGNQHYLLTVEASKRANLKKLGELVDEKLGFASPERLEKWLKSTPGTVSLMALINDPEKHVKVLIDKDLFEFDTILCHPPNDNTATLEIAAQDLKKFLEHVEHEVTFIEV